MSFKFSKLSPIALVLTSLLGGPAAAQFIPGVSEVPGTPFRVNFGGTPIIGEGRFLRAPAVPVLLTNGAIAFYNVTLEFQALPDGRLVAALASATQVNSAVSVIGQSNQQFLAGNYVEPASGCTYALNGPSVALDGSRAYTLIQASGRSPANSNSGGCIASAVWTTTSPSVNSYLRQMTTAGRNSLSTNFAYGTIGSGTYQTAYGAYFQAVGDTFSITGLDINGNGNNTFNYRKIP